MLYTLYYWETFIFPLKFGESVLWTLLKLKEETVKETELNQKRKGLSFGGRNASFVSTFPEASLVDQNLTKRSHWHVWVFHGWDILIALGDSSLLLGWTHSLNGEPGNSEQVLRMRGSSGSLGRFHLSCLWLSTFSLLPVPWLVTSSLLFLPNGFCLLPSVFKNTRKQHLLRNFNK